MTFGLGNHLYATFQIYNSTKTHSHKHLLGLFVSQSDELLLPHSKPFSICQHTHTYGHFIFKFCKNKLRSFFFTIIWTIWQIIIKLEITHRINWTDLSETQPTNTENQTNKTEIIKSIANWTQPEMRMQHLCIESPVFIIRQCFSFSCALNQTSLFRSLEVAKYVFSLF